MVKVSSEAEKVAIAKATEAGQKHIFEGWEELPRDTQRTLIRQIESLDLQLVKSLVHQCFRGKGETIRSLVMTPAEVRPLPTPATAPEEYAACRRVGEEAIAAGRIAIVMAPGSYPISPLGEPTGLVPIGPVTGKTLFQLQAEKVRALNRRHKVSLRWWIVTHPDVHDSVCEYFRKESFFGLSRSETVFLPQPLLPLVDRRGKFVFTEPGRIATEPNGHGGVLFEFLLEERLAELRERGIEHVFFFQVDNPLVQVADPAFIGHHIREGAEVSSKAIRKRSPEERLGVFCRIGGTTGVVEHADMRPEEKTEKNPDGSLVFAHAHMSVHAFSVDFFERMVEEHVRLPFHTRAAKVSCLGRKGRKSGPTELSCIQFRFFVFDALRVARHVNILEVDRDNEFAPIRHDGGDSSPEAVQRQLSRVHTRWLRSAGATFGNSSGNDASLAVEISPLYALDEEELKSRIELPLEIEQDLFLGVR